jgi:RNA methyltransferase, TrmH family
VRALLLCNNLEGIQFHHRPADLSAKEAMHEDKYPLITHPRDPRFLALRALQTERGRQQTGEYLIEGIRHLARTVEERAPIRLLFVDPSALSNPFGQKLARRIRQSSIPCIRLAPDLYRELTLANEPQGVGAVLRQRWFELNEIKPAKNSFWLAVESVDQPGNLGTILRSAEAAGVSGIFLLGPTADPWDPSCVRASMGSLFSPRLVRCTSREFVQWARSSRIAIVGSSPAGMLDYRALRCRWPAALLVGSEKRGLSGELIDASDFLVRIPMRGRCDSINASVAAGVLLFAMSGQLERTR